MYCNTYYTQSSAIDFFCVHVKSQLLNQTILLVDFYVVLGYKCSGWHSPLQEYLKLTISCQDRKVEKCNESPKKSRVSGSLRWMIAIRSVHTSACFLAMLKKYCKKFLSIYTLWPSAKLRQITFSVCKMENGPRKTDWTNCFQTNLANILVSIWECARFCT